MNQVKLQPDAGYYSAVSVVDNSGSNIIRLLPDPSQFVRRRGDRARNAQVPRERAGGVRHRVWRFLRKTLTRCGESLVRSALGEEEAAVAAFSPAGSEVRLRAALSGSAVGVALIDLNGFYTDVNETFCKITGYQRHELYLRTFRAITYPDDLQQSIDLRRRLLSGEVQTAILEKRYITKSGGVVWVQNSASAVRDVEGEIVGLIALVEDITERKRAQEALQQSEADYRSLVEHSPYGICRTTPDGKLTMANPALVELLGYSSEQELLSKDLGRDIYVNSDDRVTVLRLSEVEKSDRVRTLLKWRRKDGKPLLLNATARIVRQGNGPISFFEVTVEDITERRALEESVRKSQRMEATGQFAAGIAHDFNNLMTIVIGQSGLLLKSKPLDDVSRSRLMAIKDAGDRARWVTAQLLIYGRQRSIHRQTIDVNKLIRDLCPLFERLLGEDVLLITELAASPGLVNSDLGLLGQMIMNLAANARDAMPSGGTLRVVTRDVEVEQAEANCHPGVAKGAFVSVSVTDTGTGMEEEVVQRIFEPFFTTKGPERGTGLGLAMVQSIASQSGGYVTVSTARGQGSTFSVFLPRASEVSASVETEIEEGDFPGGSERCLVVEDTSALRDLTCEFLTSAGYQVLQAANGQEAMVVAQNHKNQIDLLLTDVAMPGMSGIELAVRLAESQPEMKVLLVSGHTDERVIQYGGANLTAGLLHKPFTQGSLLRVVREALDGELVTIRI